MKWHILSLTTACTLFANAQANYRPEIHIDDAEKIVKIMLSSNPLIKQYEQYRVYKWCLDASLGSCIRLQTFLEQAANEKYASYLPELEQIMRDYAVLSRYDQQTAIEMEIKLCKRIDDLRIKAGFRPEGFQARLKDDNYMKRMNIEQRVTFVKQEFETEAEKLRSTMKLVVQTLASIHITDN